MKPAIYLLPLLFAACAPKAIVLREATATGPAEKAERSVAGNSVNAGSVPDERLPSDGDGGLGLLDPSGLTKMPEDREMKPTVDTGEERPVIANPPTPSGE
ncbi:hypothetical protein [Haloferula helveola]